MFCSVAVLFGMGCSSVIGCFVRRFVRPGDVDLDLYEVLFGIVVLFGYSVLFGVLFAQTDVLFNRVFWAEQCSCSANDVRVQA